MPINRTYGEMIDGLGSEYEIMPLELYQNMPEFHEACDFAALKFKDSQAIDRPIRFYPDDVIAQFYPNTKPTPLLVFVFCKKCLGGLDEIDGPKKGAAAVERYVTYQFSVISPNVSAVGHA